MRRVERGRVLGARLLGPSHSVIKGVDAGGLIAFRFLKRESEARPITIPPAIVGIKCRRLIEILHCVISVTCYVLLFICETG